MQTNKRKIINDPVYGSFMTLDDDILYDIVSHPYFLRLQRIKQLGLSYLVYPGAMHTRFSHTLGATFLMGLAIDVLRSKNIDITPNIPVLIAKLVCPNFLLVYSVLTVPTALALNVTDWGSAKRLTLTRLFPIGQKVCLKIL